MHSFSVAIALFAASQSDDRILTLLALPSANALLNARKFAEAKPIYEKFVRDNPYLGSQFWNLAQCEFGLGEYEAAARHYGLAGRNFTNAGACYFRAALCLAKLGKSAESLKHLRDAAESGWVSYMDAIHEPAFKILEPNPEYRELVGLPPVGNKTRAEQWKVDLDFLRTQVYRHHFNPFTRLGKPELDRIIEDLKARAAGLTDSQIAIELYRYAALLGVGHTTVMSPTFAGGHGVPIQNPLDSTEFPLRFKWFPDGIYVVGTTKEYRSNLGKKLTGIEGASLSSVFERLDPLIAHDNDEWLTVMRPGYLKPEILAALGVIKSSKQCSMELDGKSIEVVSQVRGAEILIDFETLEKPADYRRNPEDHYWFEARPGFVYLRYRVCIEQPTRPLGTFWPEVLKELDKDESKRLVIDLRGNSGGNGHNIDALITGLAQRVRFRQPRRIIALIDRLTYSASLRACGKVEELGGLFIGEPTGGRPNSIGEMTPFILPFSKIGVSISDRYHQNAQSLDNRPFFAPRIVSEITFEEWRTNKDPAMRIVESVIKADRDS